jgi:glycerol-1-phosphate dehydrogenase [NAD(P)+]
MTTIDPIYIGKDAIPELLHYIHRQALTRFCLVADENTYPALGQRVEAALQQAGHEVHTVLLEGGHIHTDEHQCMQVFIRAPLGACTFIAVGSGTITDVTRFVSHRSGRAFISLPTAPSVDGFASVGAPVIIGGIKTTILCQAPLAIFADLETMCSAPQTLIAAGFGDMIGKITSQADWAMGRLLWDEPYDESIAQRMYQAVDQVMSQAEAIGQRSEAGVRAVMDTLIESGLCMLEFGATRPASGAEHHASHYWEMMRLAKGEETQLHGAQVGYALVLVAERYARLRQITRAQMLDSLEGAALPAREQEIATIRAGYGPMADEIIKEHLAFLDLAEADFDALKHRIVQHWDDIQAIAARVPAPEVIAAAIRAAGGPADAAALGLAESEIEPGFRYGHYLRNRFTVVKLGRILGLPF